MIKKPETKIEWFLLSATIYDFPQAIPTLLSNTS